MADPKADPDDLPAERKAAILAEVTQDPAGLGYVDVSSLALPPAQATADVDAKGSVFDAKAAAFEIAKQARNADKQNTAKQAAHAAALSEVRTAQADLAAANEAFNAPHRAIDEAAKEIADALNAPDPSATVPVGPVALERIVGAIMPADAALLDAQQNRLLDLYLRGTTVDAAGPGVRAALFAMFPDGTETNANLRAVMDRPASRAEVLFGAGVRAEPWDIARALVADKAK